METLKRPFEATSSWCYHFARYEAMPKILALPEVAKGDVVLLRDCTQQVLDKYLSPEQQNDAYQQAKAQGQVKIKSAVKFFVAYLAAETGEMVNLGKGSFRKASSTPQDLVDAVEAAAIDDAEPDDVADEDDFEGWIYAFTFPMIEQQNGPFPIKVGKTRVDVTTRVSDQCKGSATFESPKLLREWRVKRLNQTEAAIHAVLKAQGRHRETAPGKEWFDTTPAEIEKVVQVILNP